MSLPQAPRRGKDPRRPHHFAYLPIAKGERLFGYLAGPVMWFALHPSDLGSKPCLTELTGGELSCPKCKYGESVNKGACGFYRSTDHAPRMVWLDESRRDHYEKMLVFRRIMLAREREDGAAVWAETCMNQDPVWASTLPECQRAVDLTQTLLRVWALPELSLWYAHTHGRSDSGLSLPPTPAAQEPPTAAPAREVDPMYRAAHKRYGHTTDGVGVIDEAMKQALGRAARGKPSANGKHKPEGGQS